MQTMRPDAMVPSPTTPFVEPSNASELQVLLMTLSTYSKQSLRMFFKVGVFKPYVAVECALAHAAKLFESNIIHLFNKYETPPETVLDLLEGPVSGEEDVSRWTRCTRRHLLHRLNDPTDGADSKKLAVEFLGEIDSLYFLSGSTSLPELMQMVETGQPYYGLNPFDCDSANDSFLEMIMQDFSQSSAADAPSGEIQVYEI